jgi:hypothetical protein
MTYAVWLTTVYLLTNPVPASAVSPALFALYLAYLATL